MNATVAPTARPSYAVTCWCDSANIYTEIASTSGQPYIQKWPLTEGGLSKALAMMKELYVKDQPFGGDYKIPLHGLLRTVGINNFSQDQRTRARDVLKKMGIT